MTELDLEDGELVIADESFQASKKSVPFRMLITDRAIFLTRLNRTSLRQPWYLEKVPIEDVLSVAIRPVRPYGAWLLSAVLFSVGVLTLVGMYLPAYEGTGSGWPVALVVGGIVIPFVVAGRTELMVTMSKETYRWRPEIIVDRKTRAEVTRIQEAITNACRDLGVRIEAV